eukprot:Nitzschia sp. Nitz4//scaffold64_size103689//47243//48484//NITZ4_004434-RA/size103689-processed-gene-0.79-mRNA-1//1//CDS//3329556124//2149//frame0
MPNPMFPSSSSEKPQLLTISFKDDPQGSLGAQLINCDKGEPFEMFAPGFAQVGRLLDGDTVAKRSGVKVGDCIVAVSGEGFRRFAPDFHESELENLSEDSHVPNDNKVLHLGKGEAYKALLGRIKAIKSAGSPTLALSLERYGWDAKVNSWPRFLEAREGNVPAAMKMLQEHENWKNEMFPIDLTRDGIQEVLRLKAVAEIDTGIDNGFPPCVYINYSKLLGADGVSADDVCKAFIVFTELMLARSKDVRSPKTSQLIDLTGISVSTGFRVETLKKIYQLFEPNYPETLSKLVMYPVSNMLATTSRTLLSFVNEKTQRKFVVTNNLSVVCEELGWDQREVESCGGVAEFMHKYEKAGTDLILE